MPVPRSRFPAYPPNLPEGLQLYLEAIRKELEVLGVSGGASIRVEESDAVVSTSANVLDFFGPDFNLVHDPVGEVNINIDGNIARLNSSQQWLASQEYTAGYGDVPSVAANLRIGAGGSSPNAASLSWGDSTGWKLQLGPKVSGVFTPRFTFLDLGKLSIDSPSTNTQSVDIRAPSGTQNSDIVFIGSGAVTSGYKLLNIMRGASYATPAFAVVGDGSVVIGTDLATGEVLRVAGYFNFNNLFRNASVGVGTYVTLVGDSGTADRGGLLLNNSTSPSRHWKETATFTGSPGTSSRYRAGWVTDSDKETFLSSGPVIEVGPSNHIKLNQSGSGDVIIGVDPGGSDTVRIETSLRVGNTSTTIGGSALTLASTAASGANIQSIAGGRIDWILYDSAAALDEKRWDIASVDGLGGASTMLMGITRDDAGTAGNTAMFITRVANAITQIRIPGSGTGLVKLGLAGGGVTVGTDTGTGHMFRVGGSAIFRSGGLDFDVSDSGGHTGVEIGRRDGVASTPFIDFHTSTTLVDYNARITAAGASAALGEGSLRILASTLIVERGGNPGVLTLFDNDASPTNGDVVGEVQFFGKDSGAADSPFARVRGVADVVTAGSEQGRLTFMLTDAGAETNMATLTVLGFSPVVAGDLTLGTTALPWGTTHIQELNIYSGTTRKARLLWDGFNTQIVSDDSSFFVTTSGALRHVTDSTRFAPNTDGGLTLGSSSNRWGRAYLAKDNENDFVQLGNTNPVNLRSYSAVQGDLWVVNAHGSPTQQRIRISTGFDNDKQVTLGYVPGTIGAGAGVFSIGQLAKNHANYTHGFTDFYIGNTRVERQALDLITWDPDVKMDVMGTFDHTGTRFTSGAGPVADDVMSWHGGAMKWRPRFLQTQFSNGVVFAQNNTDGTFANFAFSVTYNDVTPSVPSTPIITPIYGGFIIDMGTLPPSGSSYVIDYKVNAGSYTTDRIIFTSQKMVHTVLSNNGGQPFSSTDTFTYKAKGRGSANGSHDSAYSGESTAASYLVTTEVNAFGLVLASQITAVYLSAITANIGSITAGQLISGDGTSIIQLDSTFSVPGTVTKGIFFATANPVGGGITGMYMDFTATGTNPLFHHTNFDILANGSVVMKGVLRDPNSKFVIDVGAVSGRLMTIIDEQGTPRTRVKIGEINTGASDWGIQVFDTGGTIIVDMQASNMLIQDAAVKFKIDFTNRLLTVVDEQGSPRTRIKLGEISTGTADWGMEIYADNGNKIVQMTGTAMFLQDSAATPLAGLNIQGTVPGSWTRYVNLNGSGSFAKHERLEVNFDGSVKMYQTSSQPMFKLDASDFLLQNDDASPTRGILIDGSLPGGWTRYMRLPGTGTDKFIKHELFELRHDGTMKVVKRVIILTGGSTYTIPEDWNQFLNSIELIGGGGGGGGGTVNAGAGGGGGGGGYRILQGFNPGPGTGQSITYAIGAGGNGGSATNNGAAGGNTTWNSPVLFQANGGSGGNSGGGGGGGGSSGGGGSGSGLGSLGTSGGSGGSGSQGTGNRGGGGGGGAGGNLVGGTGGANASVGTGGSGGAGGNALGGAGGGAGSAGSAGTVWEDNPGSSTAGAGGGGGGGSAGVGGAGGSYGGAGGGGGSNGSIGLSGGTGSQGCIIITYFPISQLVE